jgi:hypothetical protein
MNSEIVLNSPSHVSAMIALAMVEQFNTKSKMWKIAVEALRLNPSF